MGTIYKLPDFDLINSEIRSTLTSVKKNEISVSKATKKLSNTIQSQLEMKSSEKKNISKVIKKYFKEVKNSE